MHIVTPSRSARGAILTSTDRKTAAGAAQHIRGRNAPTALPQAKYAGHLRTPPPGVIQPQTPGRL